MKKSMLFTTIARIVVVVVALSTATFAWFSSQITNAITGNVTIKAGQDYVLKTFDADAGWVVTTNNINLSATDVSPTSPTRDFAASGATTNDRFYEHGDLTKTPVNAAAKGLWIKGNQDGNQLKNLAELDYKGVDANKAMAIQTFRVSRTDASENKLSYIEANIKSLSQEINQTAITALDNIKVVLQISEYAPKKSTTGPINLKGNKFYGTQYSFVGGGTAITGGGGANQDTIGSKTGDASTLLTKGSNSNLVAFPNTTLGDSSNGTIFTVNDGSANINTSQQYNLEDALNKAKQTLTPFKDGNLEFNTEGAGGMMVYNDNFSAIGEKGIHKYIRQQLPFAANTEYMITVYVWVDGFDAANAIIGQQFKVDIAFNTQQVIV